MGEDDVFYIFTINTQDSLEQGRTGREWNRPKKGSCSFVCLWMNTKDANDPFAWVKKIEYNALSRQTFSANHLSLREQQVNDPQTWAIHTEFVSGFFERHDSLWYLTDVWYAQRTSFVRFMIALIKRWKRERMKWLSLSVPIKEVAWILCNHNSPNLLFYPFSSWSQSLFIL